MPLCNAPLEAGSNKAQDGGKLHRRRCLSHTQTSAADDSPVGT